MMSEEQKKKAHDQQIQPVRRRRVTRPRPRVERKEKEIRLE